MIGVTINIVVGNHQLTLIRMRAEYEISHHNDIGCPIPNCHVRFSGITGEKRMEIHHALHQLIRQSGIPEPGNWTVGPRVEVLQGGENDHAIIPPLILQDSVESDSALITSSRSAENVANVTESLLEHTGGE